MLEVDVARRLGAFDIAARFVTGPGVTALFGRSGSGKTSIVNMLAGLVAPDAGRIAVEGAVLFDRDAGIDLAPERRRIGYVFQDARLLPHLGVRANLEYGQRRAPRDGRRVPFDQVVAVLGIEDLLHRRPHQLSGGEKSRIAIGRALLASPRLLLMDEPLASLDAPRRHEILSFIERLREAFAIPIVYVSHAMEEVIRLADTLVLISDGAVAATGPVEELLSRLDLRPLTGRYEAGAVIAGRVAGGDEKFGLTHLAFPGGVLRVSRLDLPDGAEVRVRIRARDVSLALVRPLDISVLNVFEGTVAEIGGDVADAAGPQLDVRLDVGVPLWARITRRSAHDLGIVPGRRVHALVKSVAIDRQSVGLR
jgi:molybdate transport system ATP-binding protein